MLSSAATAPCCSAVSSACVAVNGLYVNSTALPVTSTPSYLDSAPSPTLTRSTFSGLAGGFADRFSRCTSSAWCTGDVTVTAGRSMPLALAPTASTSGASAGEPTVLSPGPSLPAAATTTTPALTAAALACSSGSSGVGGPDRLMLTTSARCGLSTLTAASSPSITVDSSPEPDESNTL